MFGETCIVKRKFGIGANLRCEYVDQNVYTCFKMRNGEHIIINKKDFGRAYGV
jgi:hypothetical protein